MITAREQTGSEVGTEKSARYVILLWIAWKEVARALQQKTNPQEYDNSLKALFGDEAADILPLLLPGIELVGEHNVEIDRSKLRADLVYNTFYNGGPAIVNMELQTDNDSEMLLRLLQYHVGLLARYRLPVISVVLYPFEINVPVSPFEEKSGDELLLSLHFRVIALCRLEAAKFVHKRAICMYSMLPAMKGANATLLLQAIKEMQQHYSREALRHHLLRFWRIMQKSKMLSEQDKQYVEEVLLMQYDWFIETNPVIVDLVEKGEARGEAKGRAEMQQTVVEAVQMRFPALTTAAQEHVASITSLATLRRLVLAVFQAPDEAAARRLFQTSKQTRSRKKGSK